MIRNLLLIVLFFGIRQMTWSQCTDRSPARLDWDRASWLDGLTSCGYGFGTNALRISIDGKTMFEGYPNQLDEFSQSGGWSEGGHALVITNKISGSISLKLDFQSPAENIRFSLYDIDLKDEVIVTSDDAIPILTAISDQATFTITDNKISGNGSSSDKDLRGTANVEVSKASSITVIISRFNGNIYTGISDILACVDLPPSTTACQTSDQLKLSWDKGTEGYPAGALQHAIDIPNTQGTVVHADVTFEGDTDHLTATKIGTPSPDDTPRFSKTDGGLGDGSNSLKIRMDGPANAGSSSVTTRIRFNQSIEDARFSIYDIDNHTLEIIDTADRRDQVTVLGFNHGTPVTPVIEAISSSPAWDREGSVITAHPFGEYDSEDGGTRNTANIYFTQPVDEIVIIYDEKGYTDPNKPSHYDPKVRIIALTPIFFCPPVVNGEIGGELYIDLDKSNDLTPLDIPVPGTSITITNEQGEQKSIKSNPDGSYLFKGLSGGVYNVTIDEKTLPMHGLSAIDVNNGNKNDKLILESGRTVIANYNMGFEGANKIRGNIFADIQEDQLFVRGEDLPLSSVDINLVYAGKKIRKTSTNKDGSYSFNQLPVGTYNLNIDNQQKLLDLTNTVDPDGEKPNRCVLNITDARSETEATFGYQGRGSIGDQIFMDQNNNSQFDEGDTPISFINLLLVNSNQDTLVTTVDVSGQYLVKHLPYDTYLLMIPESQIPSDAINTVDPDGQTDHQTIITIGADYQQWRDQDFGFYVEVKQSDLIAHSVPPKQEGGPVRSNPDDTDLGIGTDASSEGAALKDLELAVYPNPSTNFVKIEGRFGLNSTLTVVGSGGRIIQRVAWNNQLDYRGKMTIDLSNLAAGVYHLRFSSDTGLVTIPMVKL